LIIGGLGLAAWWRAIIFTPSALAGEECFVPSPLEGEGVKPFSRVRKKSDKKG
jgi:hypothetical protein